MVETAQNFKPREQWWAGIRCEQWAVHSGVVEIVKKKKKWSFGSLCYLDLTKSQSKRKSQYWCIWIQGRMPEKKQNKKNLLWVVSTHFLQGLGSVWGGCVGWDGVVVEWGLTSLPWGWCRWPSWRAGQTPAGGDPGRQWMLEECSTSWSWANGPTQKLWFVWNSAKRIQSGVSVHGEGRSICLSMDLIKSGHLQTTGRRLHTDSISICRHPSGRTQLAAAKLFVFVLLMALRRAFLGKFAFCVVLSN